MYSEKEGGEKKSEEGRERDRMNESWIDIKPKSFKEQQVAYSPAASFVIKVIVPFSTSSTWAGVSSSVR